MSEEDQQYIEEDEQQLKGTKLEQRMANYKHHLAQKLEDMGMEINLEPPKNPDPQLQVQQEIEQLTAQLIYKTEQIIEDHLNLTDLVAKNENMVTKYYEGLLQMADVMVVFSKELYTGGEHISTFRNFKRLSDYFREYSVLANEYSPYSQQFAHFQHEFIDRQANFLDMIVFKNQDKQLQTPQDTNTGELHQLRQQNQQLKEVLRRYEEELTKFNPQTDSQDKEIHQENLRLMGQLDNLQRELNQNNQDFAIEIQRYNRLLHDERQESKKLEMDLRNQIRVLEYSTRQIEKQLSLFQEEKYKDQLMIENMIRKIRHLQKGKNSLQVGSPYRPNLNHTAVLPSSPKGGLAFKSYHFRKDI